MSTTDGDLGILAGHVPVVLELKPSVLTLLNGAESLKYFVSGGFAIVNPDSSLNINAVEAVTLDELDQDVRMNDCPYAAASIAGNDPIF